MAGAVVRREGDAAVLAFLEDLDLESSTAMADQLRQMVLDPAVRHVVLDLTDVKFADSSFLRELLVVRAELAADDVTLEVRNPQAQVLRLLEVTNLTELLGSGS